MASKNEVIVTVSLSVKDKANQPYLDKVLAAIRAIPGYAGDEAEPAPDTRRGGITVRYEPFIFHK